MIYLITNRKLVNENSSSKNNYFKVIEEAVLGGVSRIILREKDLNSEELLKIAVKISEIIEGTETKLIINSNLEVANRVKAFGVQLSYKDFLTLGKCFNGEIGVSIHSVEEGVEAYKRGASYLLASHIFETKCKEGLEPKGLKLIKELKVKVKIPVVALGGILPDNVDLVLKAGADGIAVMSTIMNSDNPKKKVEEYLSRM